MDCNSANPALVQVFVEPFGVVAVVLGCELVDSPFAVAATSFDFVESPEVSAFDPDSFSVLVGCVFSMMHAFLAIELDPSLSEFFLTATRFLERRQNDFLIIRASGCH